MGNTYLARLPTRQEMCFVVTKVEVDHEECMDCGACIRAVDEYIEKGVDPQVLLEKVEQQLAKKGID